ncbi:MAG: hypothetical protein ABSA44_09595 [Bacteroidota bacterium]
MSSQDRIAYELAGNDGTKFRLMKKENLEDVYKQLFIMQEKIEYRRQKSDEER